MILIMMMTILMITVIENVRYDGGGGGDHDDVWKGILLSQSMLLTRRNA